MGCSTLFAINERRGVNKKNKRVQMNQKYYHSHESKVKCEIHCEDEQKEIKHSFESHYLTDCSAGAADPVPDRRQFHVAGAEEQDKNEKT